MTESLRSFKHPDRIVFSRLYLMTSSGFELERKLREEVEEYEVSGDVMELVDILEIIFRVAGLKGVSRRQLEDLRKKKRVERGGFEKNLFLIES